MDEHLIATALKNERLKELLKLYLLDQGDEPADRKSLLRFAKKFDAERQTNFLVAFKNFRANDIKQLVDAYREIVETDSSATPPSTLTVAPITPPKPANVITPVRPQFRVVKTAPVPITQPASGTPAAATSPGFHPTTTPIAGKRTATTRTRPSSDLLGKLGLNPNTVILGALIIGLILVGVALLFVINFQQGGIALPPDQHGPVKPAEAAQPTTVAAPTVGPTQKPEVQSTPAVEGVPTYSTWYQWYFGLTGAMLQEYKTRCNISSDQEAQQQLTTLKASGWKASKTPQPPCQ